MNRFIRVNNTVVMSSSQQPDNSKQVRDMLLNISRTCGMPVVHNKNNNIQTKPRRRSLHSNAPKDVTKRENEELGDEDPTYTLVVVRCKANITWFHQVPNHWRIVVYDKCKRNTKKELPKLKRLIRHTPSNHKLAEECNGYLDFMHDYYDELTTVTVFMHDDGLIPYDTQHKATFYHTPFHTFEPIVNVTQKYLTKDNPFLHFGVTEMGEPWGADWYHGDAMHTVWPCFSIPHYNQHGEIIQLESLKPPKLISFKPSAHFAVRKEQIQKRPQSTYWALLQQVQLSRQTKGQHYPDARQFCCAMERMWHVFFGQPAVLPKRAMASDLLDMTDCVLCHNWTSSNPGPVNGPVIVDPILREMK
ncbi:expressed unknown protein [Seminavis robusta]|uniref:Uncharacterized protein n=1 Tax=Seminavis robusta TaxID=568900 RepID=A0A9N8EIB8_9STRA|nr:expressed unknown protein [Seminavis robusta]|eukprot:Sro1046_g235070.1 n/a (360) ;mRNA; f:24594-25673